MEIVILIALMAWAAPSEPDFYQPVQPQQPVVEDSPAVEWVQ